MFSWKPIYVELAQKLPTYRNKQDLLLTWLHEMRQAGLPAISVTDFKPKGSAIKLQEIDPFTFFANFNRGIKNEHRIEILRILKMKMGLAAELPDDFDGIPVANSQKAWFFTKAYERDPNTIPLLWDFAQDVVTHEPSKLRPELFEKCLQVKQVGLPKLTMGMFWLQPDQYVALDQVNRAYLLEKYDYTTARLKAKTLADYLTVLESIKEATNTEPTRLSSDAYTHGLKITLDPAAVDRGFRAYLERLAKKAACSVSELVERIKAPENSGESEIANRTIHQKELQESLTRGDLTKDELKSTVDKLWALQGRLDLIRRSAYFKSDQVMNDVRALLDDDSGVPVAMRINDFVEAAAAHGYSPEDGEEFTLPGQFASVLLSSRWPDRFVDFRKGRWNDLYREVMQSKSVFLRGNHYGHLLLRAGSFASLLARTPIFKELFGESNELWTVAGVAWVLKDGPPKEKNVKEPEAKPQPPVDPKPTPTSVLEKRPPLPAKNIILYGPPGTGKTYRLRTEYQNRFTERGTAKSKEQFADELVADMAWWEVSTLVLLDLKTAKVSDMLAHPLMQARIKRSATKNLRSTLWAHLQSHTKRECEDVAYANRYEPLIFWKSKDSLWSIDASLAASEVPELPEALQRWKTYRPTAGDAVRRYEFTTFHQSYSYEEFVEGIKPVLETEGSGDLRYEIKPGVLRLIAKRAETDPDHDYAIFIDEINRGNIASIFGELITLLEDDKRLGGELEIKARLPYSRDEFGVPSNLYVIGTMNTADRSVEALDTALRRRFWFIPCLPDVALLPDGPVLDLDIDLRRMLTVINGRLERILDRDHCIGHSYFMGVSTAEKPLDALRRAFANKVLPLLEEYFYGDPGKIGLVLGSAFIKKRSAPEKFAKCGWEQYEDEDRASFERADPMTLDIGAFQAIYA